MSSCLTPAEDETKQGDSNHSTRINYSDFFYLPEKPDCPSQCTAKWKLIETSVHGRELNQYKFDKARPVPTNQRTFGTDGVLARVEPVHFKNQEKISVAIVKHLCGEGRLPISIVEKEYFRSFMKVVEPKFQPISRVTVTSQLNSIYEEEKKALLDDISKSVSKPSTTVDFWTGCDSRNFLGCTIHFISEGMLRNHVLFFVEVPPPHTSDRVRARFEDELDRFGVSCFRVVSDNASNMKCAFEMSTDSDKSLVMCGSDNEEDSLMSEWSPVSGVSLKFDGWLGCASHQLQLVVNDGYKELKCYRHVQTAFTKVKAVATLSRKSSHFSYALSQKIPVANDTCWNSHYRLHLHIVSHAQDINQALQRCDRSELAFTDAQLNILSIICSVMGYFSEATNILQQVKFSTLNHVIPVIDSLENAVAQINREEPYINALCERLLNSLKTRFEYLLDSDIHKAAVALDRRKTLSFTDCQKEGKTFIFSSNDVMQSINKLLPSPESSHIIPSSQASIISDSNENHSSKKLKLLDFCSAPQSSSTYNEAGELQSYFDQPLLSNDTKPILYWTERRDTPLKTLALQVLTVPCSSAQVERLFSKAGIVLSQRRTHTSSIKLEKLIF